MTRPIGSVLAEFRPYGRPTPLSSLISAPEHDEDDRTDAEERLVARIDAACRKAADDARSAAEAAFAAERDERDILHAQHLATEREAWAEVEGAALASQIAERIATLQDTIASAVASLLEPLLPLAACRKAEDELKAALTALLDSGSDSPIHVSGRTDLVHHLQAAFGVAPGVTFEPSDAAEVTVRAGDTTIRSALTAWRDRLAVDLGRDEG